MERITGKHILFLTAARILDPEEKGLYTDLLRKFRDEGHHVFVVCPEERKFGGKTRLETIAGISILYVRSLNLQKTGVIEKGLSTLSLSWLLHRAVKRFLAKIKFDLILYSTPPITYNSTISYLKKKSNPFTYLLLKDIFPQNAVDLDMLKSGSLIHRHFSSVERRLYTLSDCIGCMSEANRDFLVKHNPYLDKERVEINPNSMDLKWLSGQKPPSVEFRKKWGIDENALICIYGGNLGKPQGIDFLIDILGHYNGDKRLFFFVVGDGTEFEKLNFWFNSTLPVNARLMKHMPKKEFDEVAQHGNVGLILLDRRFTIPNFPSRLLTYMENKMSVWAATDVNTDIGRVVEQNMFGFWIESGNLQGFALEVERELQDTNLNRSRGEAAFEHLKREYSVDRSYNAIIRHLTTRPN